MSWEHIAKSMLAQREADREQEDRIFQGLVGELANVAWGHHRLCTRLGGVAVPPAPPPQPLRNAPPPRAPIYEDEVTRAIAEFRASREAEDETDLEDSFRQLTEALGPHEEDDSRPFGDYPNPYEGDR